MPHRSHPWPSSKLKGQLCVGGSYSERWTRYGLERLGLNELALTLCRTAPHRTLSMPQLVSEPAPVRDKLRSAWNVKSAFSDGESPVYTRLAYLVRNAPIRARSCRVPIGSSTPSFRTMSKANFTWAAVGGLASDSVTVTKAPSSACAASSPVRASPHSSKALRMCEISASATSGRTSRCNSPWAAALTMISGLWLAEAGISNDELRQWPTNGLLTPTAALTALAQ